MKFMVCRKDAVDRSIKSSELFPVIVEFPEDTPHEQVVQITLRSRWKDYTPKDKSYYCVPMDNATLVSFVPRQQYDIIVTEV